MAGLVAIFIREKEQTMTIQDDETLQMYLEESIEHLADIETDLLAIEEAGADIDEDLVNKVYRAAHSIKGGAGFMGLTTIKDLTHEMENILGKIRSREMVPTPEIVNVLLMASDTLKALMNDVFTSNEVDISSIWTTFRPSPKANRYRRQMHHAACGDSPPARRGCG
jgi:chemotaxis protein histidine kinase CheA